MKTFKCIERRSDQSMGSSLLLFGYNLQTIVVKVIIFMETKCINICILKTLNRLLK